MEITPEIRAKVLREAEAFIRKEGCLQLDVEHTFGDAEEVVECGIFDRHELADVLGDLAAREEGRDAFLKERTK